MHPQIAAQLFTVRDQCKTPQDTLHTLQRLQQAGFETVQVSGICQMPAEQLYNYCQQTHMTICVTHNPWPAIRDNTDELIASHKLWGCKYIGLGGLPPEYRSLEGIRQFAKQAAPAAQKIADAGMLFCYHNHRFEFEVFQGANMLQWLDELFAPQQLGFILDTHWIHAGGCNPAAVIRQFGHRTPLVHLKDYAIVADEVRFAPIGQGTLNWQEIFAACHEIGAEYLPIEQDNCYGADPVDCLAQSLAFSGPAWDKACGR